MSRAVSPSSNKPYGVARVSSVWRLPRSSFYEARRREQHPREPMKRGPKTFSDEELVAEIRQMLAAPVFVGEGYRKIWARLRHKGVRTSKDRVLRLLRQNQLLSPATGAGSQQPARRDDRHRVPRSDVGHGRDGDLHADRRQRDDLCRHRSLYG
jgi:putative transposase